MQDLLMAWPGRYARVLHRMAACSICWTNRDWRNARQRCKFKTVMEESVRFRATPRIPQENVYSQAEAVRVSDPEPVTSGTCRRLSPLAIFGALHSGSGVSGAGMTQYSGTAVGPRLWLKANCNVPNRLPKWLPLPSNRTRRLRRSYARSSVK